MKFVHNIPQLRERRRILRRDSTKVEEILWRELRGGKLGFRFRRQYSIGGYILDFICLRQRLIIELDGPVHDKQRGSDFVRDSYFKQLDYKVLRFRNEEIEKDIGKVLGVIRSNLSPSPKSRRGVRGEEG